jgi:hypothetical protein
MGGKQYLVIISDSSNFQIIANSVESVIDVEGFSEFGEHKGIGAMKWVGLALSARSLAVFHHHAHELCHEKVGWLWWMSTSARAGSRCYREDFWGQVVQLT